MYPLSLDMVDLQNYYKCNTMYSVTLNPVDKYQYFGKVNRLRLFRSYCYEQLLATNYRYEYFIELSEPRGMKTQGYNGPRLHMHGTISFSTPKELGGFLMTGLYDLLRWTSVDIDTILNKVIWDKYISKQHLIRKNRLSNYNVIKIKKQRAGLAKTKTTSS